MGKNDLSCYWREREGAAAWTVDVEPNDDARGALAVYRAIACLEVWSPLRHRALPSTAVNFCGAAEMQHCE
jgi:hypothetical protein